MKGKDAADPQHPPPSVEEVKQKEECGIPPAASPLDEDKQREQSLDTSPALGTGSGGHASGNRREGVISRGVQGILICLLAVGMAGVFAIAHHGACRYCAYRYRVSCALQGEQEELSDDTQFPFQYEYERMREWERKHHRVITQMDLAHPPPFLLHPSPSSSSHCYVSQKQQLQLLSDCIIPNTFIFFPRVAHTLLSHLALIIPPRLPFGISTSTPSSVPLLWRSQAGLTFRPSVMSSASSSEGMDDSVHTRYSFQSTFSLFSLVSVLSNCRDDNTIVNPQAETERMESVPRASFMTGLVSQAYCYEDNHRHEDSYPLSIHSLPIRLSVESSKRVDISNSTLGREGHHFLCNGRGSLDPISFTCICDLSRAHGEFCEKILLGEHPKTSTTARSSRKWRSHDNSNRFARPAVKYQPLMKIQRVDDEWVRRFHGASAQSQNSRPLSSRKRRDSASSANECHYKCYFYKDLPVVLEITSKEYANYMNHKAAHNESGATVADTNTGGDNATIYTYATDSGYLNYTQYQVSTKTLVLEPEGDENLTPHLDENIQCARKVSKCGCRSDLGYSLMVEKDTDGSLRCVACNGRGSRLSNGTCVCGANSWGKFCEFIMPLAQYDLGICHYGVLTGTLSAPKCECAYGYRGNTCDKVPLCPPKTSKVVKFPSSVISVPMENCQCVEGRHGPSCSSVLQFDTGTNPRCNNPLTVNISRVTDVPQKNSGAQYMCHPPKYSSGAYNNSQDAKFPGTGPMGLFGASLQYYISVGSVLNLVGYVTSCSSPVELGTFVVLSKISGMPATNVFGEYKDVLSHLDLIRLKHVESNQIFDVKVYLRLGQGAFLTNSDFYLVVPSAIEGDLNFINFRYQGSQKSCAALYSSANSDCAKDNSCVLYSGTDMIRFSARFTSVPDLWLADVYPVRYNMDLASPIGSIILNDYSLWYKEGKATQFKTSPRWLKDSKFFSLLSIFYEPSSLSNQVATVIMNMSIAALREEAGDVGDYFKKQVFTEESHAYKNEKLGFLNELFTKELTFLKDFGYAVFAKAFDDAVIQKIKANHTQFGMQTCRNFYTDVSNKIDSAKETIEWANAFTPSPSTSFYMYTYEGVLDENTPANCGKRSASVYKRTCDPYSCSRGGSCKTMDLTANCTADKSFTGVVREQFRLAYMYANETKLKNETRVLMQTETYQKISQQVYERVLRLQIPQLTHFLDEDPVKYGELLTEFLKSDELQSSFSKFVQRSYLYYTAMTEVNSALTRSLRILSLISPLNNTLEVMASIFQKYPKLEISLQYPELAKKSWYVNGKMIDNWIDSVEKNYLYGLSDTSFMRKYARMRLLLPGENLGNNIKLATAHAIGKQDQELRSTAESFQKHLTNYFLNTTKQIVDSQQTMDRFKIDSSFWTELAQFAGKAVLFMMIAQKFASYPKALREFKAKYMSSKNNPSEDATLNNGEVEMVNMEEDEATKGFDKFADQSVEQENKSSAFDEEDAQLGNKEIEPADSTRANGKLENSINSEDVANMETNPMMQDSKLPMDVEVEMNPGDPMSGTVSMDESVSGVTTKVTATDVSGGEGADIGAESIEITTESTAEGVEAASMGWMEFAGAILGIAMNTFMAFSLVLSGLQAWNSGDKTVAYLDFIAAGIFLVLAIIEVAVLMGLIAASAASVVGIPLAIIGFIILIVVEILNEKKEQKEYHDQLQKIKKFDEKYKKNFYENTDNVLWGLRVLDSQDYISLCVYCAPFSTANLSCDCSLPYDERPCQCAQDNQE
eukprot:Nk52_evm7s1271 gene=Nk52_evmTU7s1271